MLKSLVLLVAAAAALTSSSSSGVDAAKPKVPMPKSFPPVYTVDYAATKTWLETVDLDEYVKQMEADFDKLHAACVPELDAAFDEGSEENVAAFQECTEKNSKVWTDTFYKYSRKAMDVIHQEARRSSANSDPDIFCPPPQRIFDVLFKRGMPYYGQIIDEQVYDSRRALDWRLATIWKKTYRAYSTLFNYYTCDGRIDLVDAVNTFKLIRLRFSHMQSEAIRTKSQFGGLYMHGVGLKQFGDVKGHIMKRVTEKLTALSQKKSSHRYKITDEELAEHDLYHSCVYAPHMELPDEEMDVSDKYLKVALDIEERYVRQEEERERAEAAADAAAIGSQHDEL